MFLVRSVLVVASILLLVAPAQACVPLPPQGLRAFWKDQEPTTIILKWLPPVLADEVGVDGYNVHHLIDDELLEPTLVTGSPGADGHFQFEVSGVGSGAHILFVTAVEGSLQSAPGNVVVVVGGQILLCTPVMPTLDPRGVLIDSDCLDGP